MLTRISAPGADAVSLEDAKAHLAVIGSSDDALLQRLVNSAITQFDGPEGKIGRCLISQSWRLDLNGFVGNIRLPLPPVISVSGITYVASGTPVTLDPSEYSVAGLGSADHCVIAPVSRWPSASSVSIEFVAGFGDDADDVPEDIRNAILSVVASSYAWRESQILTTGSLVDNPEVADVVDRWRVRGFG